MKANVLKRYGNLRKDLLRKDWKPNEKLVGKCYSRLDTQTLKYIINTRSVFYGIKSILWIANFMTFILSSHFAVGERIETILNNNWKFKLEDKAACSVADYNDSDWEVLDVSHDWSFEKGVRVGGDQGRGGGNYDGGIGWYQENDGMDGDYTLRFHYTHNDQESLRPMILIVNSKEITTFDFKPTGSWTEKWKFVSTRVKFKAGANYITLKTTGQSGPHIDEMFVE